MVVVPNEAKLNELAEFYVETVSNIVADVVTGDYKNFTKFIEEGDKPILITPINFIVYLTGVSQIYAHDCYLQNVHLDNLLMKRKALGGASEV